MLRGMRPRGNILTSEEGQTIPVEDYSTQMNSGAEQVAIISFFYFLYICRFYSSFIIHFAILCLLYRSLNLSSLSSPSPTKTSMISNFEKSCFALTITLANVNGISSSFQKRREEVFSHFRRHIPSSIFSFVDTRLETCDEPSIAVQWGRTDSTFSSGNSRSRGICNLFERNSIAQICRL